MILGIGTDLVDIRRIERSLMRFGSRFENKIFTQEEQKYAQGISINCHPREGGDLKLLKKKDTHLRGYDKFGVNRDAPHTKHNAGIKAIASIYAKRFAAKEACAKALATGIGQGISWLDIEIIKKSSGAVGLQLTGNALNKLQKIIPSGMKSQVFLSLTDEYPYAQAHVIISASDY